MKTFFTAKRLLVGLFVATAIITGAFGAKSAFADNSINDKLSQTKEDVAKLLKIQDDTTIPSDQKQEMEIDLRREIISNILDVSQSQLNDTQYLLSTSTLPEGDEWNNVRDYLLSALSRDDSYYNETKKSLDDSQDMTLSDLRDFAKALESMKSDTIDKDVARVNNVLAAANINNILSVADSRLTKVGSDINKIYSNKLTKNQTLKTLYSQSSENLKNAHQLDDAARQAIINIYTSTTTTSTIAFVNDLKEKILTQKESSLETASSPSTDSLSASSVIKVTREDFDYYVANAVAGAYNSIKTAYDIFVKMSVNVKKYLQ